MFAVDGNSILKRLRSAPVFVVALLALLTLGKRSVSLTGHGAGGDEGCNGAGSEPLSSAQEGVDSAPWERARSERPALPRDAFSATDKAQQGLERYGSHRSVVRLPRHLVARGAAAMAHVTSTPDFEGVAPEQLDITPGPSVEGKTLLLIRQRYQGVPVYGAEVRVWVDESSHALTSNGALVANLQLDVTPKITEAEATRKALTTVGCDGCNADLTRKTLLIQRLDGIDHLVFRVWARKSADDQAAPMVFVDAHSGEVLSRCAADENPLCFDRG